MCVTCAPKWAEPEDGFVNRLVVGTVREALPSDHGLRVGGEFFPMDVVHCDDCNNVLAAGEQAVAVSVRRGEWRLVGHAWDAWPADYLSNLTEYKPNGLDEPSTSG